jgi:hypothetical protein
LAPKLLAPKPSALTTRPEVPFALGDNIERVRRPAALFAPYLCIDGLGLHPIEGDPGMASLPDGTESEIYEIADRYK